MQYPARRSTRVGASQFAPIVAALALASCSARNSAAPAVIDDLEAESTSTSQRASRVVLITIDGARWQEVFEGSDPERSGEPWITPDDLLPRSRRLVATRGVAVGGPGAGCGTVHTAGASNMSFPGYIEIFTGHASHCLDNRCDDVEETVLDEAARSSLGSAASIASWEVLAGAAASRTGGAFVSAGRFFPGEPADVRLAEAVSAGRRASPYPGIDGYRPDEATAAIALEYLRVEKPALFHIGLGDTDEYGHRGNYHAYLDALRGADRLVGAVADTLDAMGPLGERTTVIVTADHGRAVNFNDHGALHPESGRSFVLAFGGGIPVSGVTCAPHDVTLADVAPTIRVLMGLGRDVAGGAGTPIRLITAVK